MLIWEFKMVLLLWFVFFLVGVNSVFGQYINSVFSNIYWQFVFLLWQSTYLYFVHFSIKVFFLLYIGYLYMFRTYKLCYICYRFNYYQILFYLLFSSIKKFARYYFSSLLSCGIIYHLWEIYVGCGSFLCVSQNDPSGVCIPFHV